MLRDATYIITTTSTNTACLNIVCMYNCVMYPSFVDDLYIYMHTQPNHTSNNCTRLLALSLTNKRDFKPKGPYTQVTHETLSVHQTFELYDDVFNNIE